MITGGYIDLTGMPTEGATHAAIKAAIEAGLKHWHARILRRHFEPGASSRYGYKKRTRRYDATKLRRFGHTTPLVYSGAMRHELLMRTPRITGTHRAMTMRLRARALRFSAQAAYKNYPDMRAEVRAMTPDEEAEIVGVIEKSLAAALNSLPTRQRLVA